MPSGSSSGRARVVTVSPRDAAASGVGGAICARAPSDMAIAIARATHPVQIRGPFIFILLGGSFSGPCDCSQKHSMRALVDQLVLAEMSRCNGHNSRQRQDTP